MIEFSIILPVRNGGNYVKECVNSIIAQTYTNYNLIVLDNNSTDGTKEWITSLNSDKIIIYPSSKDLTIEDNWARVVKIPKNEFMTLIGHDDVLYPSYLQVMSDLIEEYPEASLYQTHFSFINQDGNVIRGCKRMPPKINGEQFLEMIFKEKLDIIGTGFLLRSVDYDSLGGIPINYPSLLFADFELWFKCAQKKYLAVSPINTFTFRLHQSTTSVSGSKKLLTAFGVFVQSLSGFQKENTSIEDLVRKDGFNFLVRQSIALSHRFLKSNNDNESGLTVRRILNEFSLFSFHLKVNKRITPYTNLSTFIAYIIDNNILLKKLFLMLKGKK